MKRKCRSEDKCGDKQVAVNKGSNLGGVEGVQVGYRMHILANVVIIA